MCLCKCDGIYGIMFKEGIRMNGVVFFIRHNKHARCVLWRASYFRYLTKCVDVSLNYRLLTLQSHSCVLSCGLEQCEWPELCCSTATGFNAYQHVVHHYWRKRMIFRTVVKAVNVVSMHRHTFVHRFTRFYVFPYSYLIFSENIFT
jgi:hypothetical protein